MARKWREYLVPKKEDLQEDKEKLTEKHFRLEPNNSDKIKKYAKFLKRSESDVANEMLRIGTTAFEIKYDLQSKIAPVEQGRDNNDLVKHLNQNGELIREKRKAETAKKSKELEDAYSRKIAHDYTNEHDWVREGY